MKDTGGPAFPTETEHQSGPNKMHLTGMDLRDFFAAAALAGLLPARAVRGRTAFTEMTPDVVATCAYEIADAMLAERERET